jgi:hypothetical protein
MAAPNYQFEKRKRDNAKKAAKDAKRQKKREKGDTPPAIVIIAQNEQDAFVAVEDPPVADAAVSE